jgi:hypothetical protein
MVGRSTERQGRLWWWVDQGGCPDLTATEPYGGSRAAREEKTTKRRNQGLAWPPAQARWKKTKQPSDSALVKQENPGDAD